MVLIVAVDLDHARLVFTSTEADGSCDQDSTEEHECGASVEESALKQPPDSKEKQKSTLDHP